MVEHRLDTENSILYLWPKSALEKSDFVQTATAVDPYIDQDGSHAGLVIETHSFPGWESLGAMAAHFRFVKDHHEHIKKIAIVTDSAIGNVAEHLASHFVSAEIRHFAAGELETAKQWVVNYPTSRVTIHQNPNCPHAKVGPTEVTRHVLLNIDSVGKELARFRNNRHRFASTAEYNDMWLLLDFQDLEFEKALGYYIKKMIGLQYAPIANAEAEIHCA